MRLSAILSFSRVLLILSFSLPALAGSLPPCIKAASSKSGNFLVVMNMVLDPPQSGVATRRIRQFSFEVFPKESFINPKDRLTAPARFFTDWAQWGVVLDPANNPDRAFTEHCPLPLVTDDGEFLILITQIPAYSLDEVVSRIYRRDRLSEEIPGHSRLIREIPLKEFYIRLGAPFYNPLEIPFHIQLETPCCTDESPQWFAGGSFTLSSDDRQLIYKGQHGDAVCITLSDGSVWIN